MCCLGGLSGKVLRETRYYLNDYNYIMDHYAEVLEVVMMMKVVYVLRSGSAADTQAIADMVTYQLGFHRYTHTHTHTHTHSVVRLELFHLTVFLLPQH